MVTYWIICGRKECSEVLGFAVPGDTVDDTSEHDAENALIAEHGEELGYRAWNDADGRARKTWYLVHTKKKYRADEHGEFHVVESRRRRPRRPLPEDLQQKHYGASTDDPVRTVIGVTPQLPLHLHCPACKQRRGETRNRGRDCWSTRDW